MKAIPLTRARHAGNFATALASKGVPVAGYLERCKLPGDLLERGCDDSLISAVNMLSFAEHAAVDSGVSDLGYWAGMAPIEGYGTFGATVAESPALHVAIQTFCGHVRTECSEADYCLTHDGMNVWFCHGRGGGDPLQQQHELYALSIMIQVIRLGLGAAWKPSRIRLQRRDATGIADNEFLRSTNVELGSPVTGIAIDRTDLAARIESPRDILPRSDAPSHGKPANALPVDHLIALQELIRNQLRQSLPPTVELAAEEAGVSKRTLQRYLAT